MRILLVIENWAAIGGSERYALDVAELLSERGHEVSVLCAKAGAAFATRHGPIVEPLLLAKHLSRVERARLRERVLAARPELLFVVGLKNVAAFGELVELAPLVRFVQDHTLFCPGLNKLWSDGTRCARPMGRVCLERAWFGSGCLCLGRDSGRSPITALWGRRREIQLCARAKAIVVASRYMERELAAVGLDPRRIARIPYFTRSEDPQPGALPSELLGFLARGSEPLILCPARLVLPDKGVDVLISALAATRGPWRAVIAGDGPARAWLAGKARAELDPARVHFAGWLAPAALDALTPLASVVVVPSMWDEPFGLVGLEAMAHGRAVVAFAVGGIVDWLADGENGLLVPRGDVGGLARAMERVLGDPGLAAELGRAGRTRLEREFSRAQHARALEAVFADSLRG